MPSSLTSPTHHPASHLQVRLAVDARLKVQPAGGAAVPAAGADADAGSRSVRRRRPARWDPAPHARTRARTAPDAPVPLLSSPQPANGQSTARLGDPARDSRQPTRDSARESAAAAAVPPATAVPHATAGHAHKGTRVAPPSVFVARTGHCVAIPAGNCTSPASVLFIPRRRTSEWQSLTVRRLPFAAQGAHHSLPSRTNGTVHGVSSRRRQAASGHRRRGGASHLLPGRRRRDQDGVHGAEFRRR